MKFFNSLHLAIALCLVGATAQADTRILLDYNDGVPGGGHDEAVNDGGFTGNHDPRGDVTDRFTSFPEWKNADGNMRKKGFRRDFDCHGINGELGSTAAGFFEDASLIFYNDLNYTIEEGDVFSGSFLLRRTNTKVELNSSDKFALQLFFLDGDRKVVLHSEIILADRITAFRFHEEGTLFSYESIPAPAAASGKNLFYEFGFITEEEKLFVVTDNHFLEVRKG